jgi:hypothetical protein
MTITLTPDLEQALAEHAQRRGTTPESLVVLVLREKFVLSRPGPLVPPQALDEWERTLEEAASPCGVCLPDEAVSSEGLYD